MERSNLETAQTELAWHALSGAEVGRILDSGPAGLTEGEAARRLEKHGPNRLPEQTPPPLWRIVLRQFADPLIYVLLAAAAVSLATGDVKDAGFIGAVLAVNAAVGAWQESKAERSSHALRRLLRTRASVRRDDTVRDVPADEVVPGDWVRLESGNRVPADVRLVESTGLEIDESLLTGESQAAAKDAGTAVAAEAPVGDRGTMAYAGSVVARGRGAGVVVATGLRTQVGDIAADLLHAEAGKPPLVERMERFSKAIAVGTLTIAVAIGAAGYALGRSGPAESFLFVVALAVAAIPEGLPVAMTVALAVATNRMAKRGMIVRKLAAVEGLGSATLIATDKTGTLTANEMTVRELRLPDGRVCRVTGTGFAPEGEVLCDDGAAASADDPALAALVESGVLCNEADLHAQDGAWIGSGDAVDLALLALGMKLGRSRDTLLAARPQRRAVPFESERQYAAAYHESAEGLVVYAKGAPERMFDLCRLAEPERDAATRAATALAAAGYRVLAFAAGPAGTSEHAAEPEGLRYLGLVGMFDPPRPGVREAVAACRSAGIRVAMVTGDHRVTAAAIGRDLGLLDAGDETADGSVVTGGEWERMAPTDRTRTVGRARVFARVAPRQKLEIVETARRAGEFVVVTGDGANDAPALKAANIGVAMGKGGTDVAREAASLVLSDDNFTTIVAGVEEGRVAYDNVRKVVFLLVSAGAAELLTVLLTVLAGYPLPLLPVQLLWLNLVTNGIQGVALAFEPGEGDALSRRPRPPEQPIFDRLMIERTVVSVATMGLIGFACFAGMVETGRPVDEARNVLLLLMVLFENVHIGNCRSETRSAFGRSPFRSPFLMAGAAGAFLLHLAAMHLPFMNGLVGVGPVSPATWLWVLPAAFAVIPAVEIQKWWWNRRLSAGRYELDGGRFPPTPDAAP